MYLSPGRVPGVKCRSSCRLAPRIRGRERKIHPIRFASVGRRWPGYPPTPVETHFGIFEGGQSFVDKRVDLRQKRLQLLPGIHDLHHDGQVEGEPLDLEGMKPAMGAEAHQAPSDRRPRQPSFPSPQHQPLVERPALVLSASPGTPATGSLLVAAT